MAYISKNTVLEAYKRMSTLSTDPQAQGATQRISAIRYLLALDMFYRQYGRECNSRDKNDATAYIKNVGKVVSVNISSYTPNFHYPLNDNADYSVRSNFYSVNIVRESLTNDGTRLAFPRRGDKPIMYVQTGKLYEDNDLIKNLSAYISSPEHKTALVLWLLRNAQINSDNVYVSSLDALKTMFTQPLVDVLMPSQQDFNNYCQLFNLDFGSVATTIEDHDIRDIFEPVYAANEIINLLKEKKNVILTGAPGTGKTFTAKAIAAEIISNGKSDWNHLTEEQKKQVAFVQFHPSYDYTDFVEGLRPGENAEFRRQDGAFKAFCKRAINSITNESSIDCDVNLLIAKYIKDDMDILSSTKQVSYHIDSFDGTTIALSGDTIKGYPIPVTKVIKAYEDKLWESGKQKNGNDSYTAALAKHIFDAQEQQDKLAKNDLTDSNKYIFIIDEINRGELSKIFGELFYAIEPDYRGPKGTVQTQYNNMVEDDDVFKSGFYIPENVYIIGTMNDVDRGVEAMDFAIRRRFAWKEVTAEESADSMGITGLALEKMKALNKALIESGLSRAYCIGGAYFRKLKNEDYDSLWKYHLEGIVYEYFRGEPDADEKLKVVEQAFKNANLPASGETSNAQEETE